jgi:1-deoxy-D-xylulose-5-phosphate synthase
MSMLTPSDENECRQALTTAFRPQPPGGRALPARQRRRGGDPGLTDPALGQGRGATRAGARPAGQRVAILAFGTLLHPALAAADKLDATVANMRFAKPLDIELVLELARSHDALVTVEEGCIHAGGAGSAVGECLACGRLSVPVLHLGLPDRFIEHGDPAKLLAHVRPGRRRHRAIHPCSALACVQRWCGGERLIQPLPD